MYLLPINTKKAKLEKMSSIAAFADLMEETPNVAWIPAEYAGANYGLELQNFQYWAIQNKVTVFYPRNLIYVILAHIPPGLKAPEYPIGFPTAYNQRNRETSILFLEIEK